MQRWPGVGGTSVLCGDTHTQKVLLKVEREDEDEGAVGSKRPPLKKKFTPE